MDADDRTAPGREYDLAELGDWLDGRLDSARVAHLQEAAARDPVLRHDLEWMAAFLALRREIVVAEPPDALHRALVARFTQLRGGGGLAGTVRRLVATLSVDSHAQPMAPGVRGAGSPTARQLVYSVADLDVAIDVRQHGPGPELDLAGQVLDPSAPGGGQAVQLCALGREVAIATADELGMFTFEAVQPGSYDLVIARQGVEVDIGPLDARV